MAFSYRHFGALRLLLASLVVFQHFTANAAPEAFHDTMMLYWGGDIAVLVFFALSGFVIAEAVDCIYFDKPLSFITNRFLRIVPHFLLAVLMSVALHYAFFTAGTLRVARDLSVTPGFGAAFGASDILLNCVGFLPIPLSRLAHYDFLDVAWAVRIEMAFYLAVFVSLLCFRLFSWTRSTGLAVMALGATLLYVASAIGFLPPKVGLIAYFAFGYGLYAATAGSRAGLWFSCLCIPAIALHFANHPNYTAAPGVARDLLADFLLLGALLAVMAFLAFRRFNRFRREDRFLGEMTYPLYMYHINVLIVLLSLTAGYHYAVYIVGMGLSILVAYAMSATIDPLVNRFRDAVRGRKVDGALVAAPVRARNAERFTQAG